MAMARPDISTQLRFRKQQELQQGIAEIAAQQRVDNSQVKILTSCPACQQGLSRYQGETGLKTDYIVVEMANHLLGDGWQQQFTERARSGGIERILL
jgi:Fe-S oxidoreductase